MKQKDLTLTSMEDGQRGEEGRGGKSSRRAVTLPSAGRRGKGEVGRGEVRARRKSAARKVATKGESVGAQCDVMREASNSVAGR
jgi:hypothetical protein